jgi:hypothetical protein
MPFTKKCGNPQCGNKTQGVLCRACDTGERKKRALKRWESRGRDRTRKVLEEGQLVAPPRINIDEYDGEAVVVACFHNPFYSVDWVLEVCETANRLNIPTLIVAGDFLQADRLSKYDQVGATTSISDELLTLKGVLDVLLETFDRIILMYGNHDQRIERQFAKASETKGGRNMLDLLAARMGQRFDPEDMAALAESYIQHFVQSDKVQVVRLPELIVNGRWRIMHAGASRTPPAHERAMIHKHRQSVIGANSHLFAVGFDNSAEDVAFTVGHACDKDRYRYIHEKPSSFPEQVRGMGLILRRPSDPTGPGFLVPIAQHSLWFTIRDLADRLK